MVDNYIIEINLEKLQKGQLMNILRTLIAALLFSFYIPTLAAASPPEKVIVDTSERMLDIIRKEGDALRENREKVYKVIDEVINPHIDFERMSRWVLGKYWRKATAEQKSRFTKEFRFLLMRTYATAITEYSGEKIKYLPVRFKTGDTDVSVRTELRQPGNPNPIPVHYRLHKLNGEWKVYDIVIEGVSLISNYRSSFATQIRRGSIQELIDTLAEHNKKKRAG